MPRLCKICAHPDQNAVKAAFASDASDRELARQFGVSHMAIGRHRRHHIVRPMQAVVAALDRGRASRQQRANQLAAIEQGDPVAIATASLGLAAQAAKLERIEGRLERMAAAAEANHSAQGVAVLSGHQLRSVETGAKLAGIGGFASVRTADQAATQQTFSIQIVFGHKTETITTLLDNNCPPVVDARQGIHECEDHDPLADEC